MAWTLRHVAACLVLLVAGLGLPALTDHIPVANAAGGPLAQNDAGSGMDAPDSPAEAFVVASAARKYTGNLTPVGTDLDWYRHLRTEAFCSTATLTLTTAGVATLTSDPFRSATAARSAEPHQSAALTLAAPAGKSPHLGIEGGVRLMSTEDGPKSPGRYTFALQSFSRADLDPENDGEAPEAGPTASSSAALPGACTAGRLAGGDVADAFHVDVTDARDLTVSLARARGTADVALDVVSPAGDVVATIASGEAADVWASSTGRWLLVVRSAEAAAGAPTALALPTAILGTATASGAAGDEELDVDYLIGLTDGPGGNPCRPSCYTGT